MVLGSPLYRLLGDDARLRILRLLAAERLNVSELTGILGLAQSGVSRHLGMLKDAGLISEQREGAYTWYRLAPGLQDGGNGFGPLWPLLQAQFDETGRAAAGRADDARLEEVRRLRKENFEQHSGPDARERQLGPGRGWPAGGGAPGHLLPPLRVADPGWGAGYLAIDTSRWASRVIAIDRSRAVLEKARALAARRGVRNVTWRCGDIERLPLRDATVDLALLSQALHHAASPGLALAEAHRILVPGGRVLVLDLREHDQAWVTERLGDRWRGFADEALQQMMRAAGFTGVRVSVGTRRAGDPFTVLIASGAKRAAAKRRMTK